MRIISKKSNIELRTILVENLAKLWEIMYRDNSKWMEFDGPYFDDPIYEKEDFINNIGPKHYALKENRLAIIKDKEIIGTVNYYFEDGSLRKWLEVGITIYDSCNWGNGFGFESLSLFISYLFDTFKDIRRIGFTTWSGNYGMMGLGDKLGFKKEAQIREVRFWKNKYWDSLKYGILREEWKPIGYQLIN